MITTEVTIRRSSALWGGISPETVQRYRGELEELKGKLDEFDRVQFQLFCNEELMRHVKSEIDQEIKYCLFYDELRGRQANEANFNEWVLTKQEDIPLKNGWYKPDGEQWTKTNGRIRATIQFDRSGKMVKIVLDYENDTRHLNFYERPYHSDLIASACVKSESSITARVEEMKSQADAFLVDHLYPRGATTEFDMLKQLLLVD